MEDLLETESNTLSSSASTGSEFHPGKLLPLSSLILCDPQSHHPSRPSCPQVSDSAGGRGTQEVSVSAARRLLSLGQSLVLHWRASKRGGVWSANQTSEILGVVQRLHPVPGAWRSVSHTPRHTPRHTHTQLTLIGCRFSPQDHRPIRS